MIVGCYDLHLYCDGIGCEVTDIYSAYYGQRRQFEHSHASSERGAYAAARKKRWKLFPMSGHCLCPQCGKRGAKIDPEAT